MIGNGWAATAAGVVTTVAVVAASTMGAQASGGADAASGHRLRCTIVGTPHADRLHGTSRHDVICGRGGNDVLDGRGGDDVLIGGTGADRLLGGDGSDVLRGGDGRDQLVGGAGPDLLTGNGGGDTERGDAGRDRLLGGAGNDDLDGGPAADHLDGGDGTNWCIVDAQDVSQRCVHDTQPAVADQVEWTPDTVDVTSADREATLRIHVTDDTGASHVVAVANGGGYQPAVGTLVSGTVRNGWWSATITVPRHAPAGSYHPDVHLEDRVGHRSEDDFDAPALTIADTDPDTELPSVTLLTPAPTTTYDVTSSSAVVTVKARIVDALSGVDADQTWFTLRRPTPEGSQPVDLYSAPSLVSGTLHDGTWRGSFTLPKGAVGGDWTIAVNTSDLARTGSLWTVSYWGPAYWSWGLPLPDGMGNVRVVGSDHPDSTPPAISSATVSPTTVDTLPGPAEVSVSAQVSDAGTGTRTVAAWLRSADTSDADLATQFLSLASGDTADGLWTGTLTLPQGTPPGTYYLSVYAEDNGQNQNICASPDYPWPLPWGCTLPVSTTVTVTAPDPPGGG